MKILLIGGGGYVGTSLTNFLIKKSFKVRVIDSFWFGNKLMKNKNLEIIKLDIRKIELKYFKNIDLIIHLANVANDPAVELNPVLSWEVNVLSSYKIAELAIKAGVKKILYASSGSVYGVKKEKKVTENLELVPVSTYNKTKMIAERVFMSFSKDIKICCIRPATVCGLSPRMRLDLTVNLLTLQALQNKKITVYGGNQVRPNIHINDLIEVYYFFIKNQKLPSGFYNAGFENLKVSTIAKIISKKTGAKIIYLKSNDIRSYRQDSSKLTKLGFRKKYGVENAIDEMIRSYKEKKLKILPSCYTVSWMKKKKIK
jgi:nucleoside-diphosphate-sugar epimerase